ncbi:putative IAA acetyltransferase [Vibrio nigripulchritudo MADA3029]|uniref:GNAT family N-acetyltransferase n=1 Tax=Vibrio nigripulchritudo TaxID=28173 RepID=UPI0003B2406E|nr:GNAT family N-acetyltransferase [Vibrio nigripulchritudo]CCN47535.1 putative IAA acetyltransferase [Vibrio nigripulchritudo MADA3020]CCN55943.1 putative IAA acetyltransferase [Vibrio nigripulchritudo MADA3021]CCN57165.1 putative IAA acetyltransferase [Vibrio nigripulchritudo MADA3029]
MQINTLNSSSLGVPEVIQEIDELMNSLYPAESNDLLPLHHLDEEHVYFAGIYQENELAACGAVVFKDDDGVYGEFKRIYVKPKFRGKDFARQVIKHLMDTAQNRAIPVLRLETGNKQAAAINLYESLGFTKRDQFGRYEYDPLSVYMEFSFPY